MGVYIKGVTKSQLMKVIINSTEFMPDDFEVIEVKTPHGRLVDANERVDVTVYDDEFEEYSDITVSVDEALLRWGTDYPKTVIEAEVK